MNFKPSIALILALLTVSGCAGSTSGPIPMPADAVASEPGKARLVISRSDNYMYLGVPARLTVNGEQVASLWRGGSYTANVVPGQVIVTTEAWSSPGHFSLKLDAKPDTTYMMLIEPRSDSVMTGALGGIIGLGAEAQVSENAGSFQITIRKAAPSNTSN